MVRFSLEQVEGYVYSSVQTCDVYCVWLLSQTPAFDYSTDQGVVHFSQIRTMDNKKCTLHNPLL